MTDAEIIQLGARGRAGRGSRSAPSAAARSLAGSARRKPVSDVEAESDVLAGPHRRPPRAVPPVSDVEPPGAAGIPPVAAEPEQAATRPAGRSRRARDDEPPPPPAAEARSEDGPDGGPLGEAGQEVPPAIDLAALLNEAGSVLRRLLESLEELPIERARIFAADPVRGALALAQDLGVDWQANLDDVVAFARSRISGTYAVDEFGFDPEFTEQIFLPVMRPLVENWFRVEVRGVENLPLAGPVLLVSNHAGTLPLDGLVLHTVVFDEIGRHVRQLGADLVFKTPFSHDFARRIGTTLACQEDAERLLHAGEVVAVYPEGFKGLGKPYADRYKLQRFGRGGFVSAAVRAQVPIIPVSIVGSEEIFPLLSTAPTLARAMGVPYFPITPLFPWFGVFGMIPLPSKWIISFGEAITTDELPAGAADDPMVVFNVTDQVRETIQHSLYDLLMQRRSAFF